MKKPIPESLVPEFKEILEDCNKKLEEIRSALGFIEVNILGNCYEIDKIYIEKGEIR